MRGYVTPLQKERRPEDKMRTIAIMNLKGGVAKTVTAVNLAANLAALHEKRVLVIDADSQANSTEFFSDPEYGVRASEETTLADLLRMDPRLVSCAAAGEALWQAIQPSSFEGVDLLPADSSLMDLDLSKVESAQVCTQVLALGLPELADGYAFVYDFVLIDCPPAFNASAAAALLASDEVLIPIKLDAFSLRGMVNLMEQIKNMQQINPELRILGLLPTMWYASDEIKAAERILRDSGLPVLPHIRRSAMVDGMTFKQEPLIRCSPKSGACRDYKLLAKRIVMEGGAVNG